jgi:hypothetical protein
VISSQSSYRRFASSCIARAFSFITPLKHSAPLFCACVSGAEGLSLIDRDAHYLLTSCLTITILLLVSMTFIVMLNCFFIN